MSLHPLAPNYSGMSDAELEKSVTELSKRLTQCFRMNNGALTQQVQMLYTEALEERGRRERVKMEELMRSAGKDFDDIIDIG
jgi:hypothetical protein